MRNAITPLLLTAFAGAWFYVFSTIALTGGYMAYEPNKAILFLELVLAGAGAIWGLIAFLLAHRQTGGQVPLMLAVLLLSLAALGVFHQWLTAGIVWQWGQFWHHENLVACTVVAAAALLAGYGLTRRHP